MKLSKCGAFAALAFVACAAEHTGTSLTTQAVDTVCLDPTARVPADGWECGQPLRVQCGAVVPSIYVRGACGAQGLRPADVVTNQVGTQTIEVRRDDGSVACSATLTVLPGPPVITPRTLFLWPPNHKLHEVSVADCIGAYAACDPDLRAEFSWGSSDEAAVGKGDGHRAPDIVFDGCDRVRLRSERQGESDGRVYRLGLRIVDGAGNVTDSECTVIVEHDQHSAAGADGGEAYRIALDGRDGAPSCEGALTAPNNDTDATEFGSR